MYRLTINGNSYRWLLFMVNRDWVHLENYQPFTLMDWDFLVGFLHTILFQKRLALQWNNCLHSFTIWGNLFHLEWTLHPPPPPPPPRIPQHTHTYSRTSFHSRLNRTKILKQRLLKGKIIAMFIFSWRLKIPRKATMTKHSPPESPNERGMKNKEGQNKHQIRNNRCTNWEELHQRNHLKTVSVSNSVQVQFSFY